jgi:serine/threonine-protein kinase
MASPDAELDGLIGTLVGGKYRVERLLGKGGMGAVYQATHQSIGKRVALKFLDRHAARDVDAVARFQREAEAASAVESAHIVHIFDSGVSADGLPYLVLELLQGEDLRARLVREKRLATSDAVSIATQVLRALARAHAAGIVHRDLKPENVFLCRRDDEAAFVKLVDFGISKIAHSPQGVHTLTQRGMVLGTAFYMSPEQAQAFPDVDGRSDLYSLGAIMFEALAGTPPHTGSAYEAILVNICTKDADDVRQHAPEVPERVAQVITRALRRSRDDRYQSAVEFLEALQAASRQSGVAPDSSARSNFGSAAAALAKRHATRTAVAVIVAVLAAFTATALLLTKRTNRADAAAPMPAPALEATALPAPARPLPSLAVPSAALPLASPAASDQPPKQPRPPTRRTAGAPTQQPASKSSAPPPVVSGVARGLQLKTSDP